MKYGLLMHGPTTNLGDDIQSYAISQFLPHIDYLIDREKINSFKSENGEPVATVMAAWWMWNKWNWPPSKYIYPHFVGFHYSDNDKAKQAGCPVDYLFLTGIGGKDGYLKEYGPVGCRDYFTRDKLREVGVDAEFSGCITLTLPQQKKIEKKNRYICLVDVAPKVEKKVREMVKGTDIEIKCITHDIDQKVNQKRTWEERSKNVEDVLTIYQNAECVITRRLHCALPCLAMGVPTLLVIHTLESIRFIPYYDWLYCCKPNDFVSGKYKYDILNPPKNKTEHMQTRENLIASVKKFVDEAGQIQKSADEINRMSYSEDEIAVWRNQMMKRTAEIWEENTKSDVDEKKKLFKQYMDLEIKSLRDRKQKIAKQQKEMKRNSLVKRNDSQEFATQSVEKQNQVLEKDMRTYLNDMRTNYKEIKQLQDNIKKLT